MAGADVLADVIGGELGRQLRCAGDRLCELRIRADKPSRLRLMGGSELAGETVSRQELRRILSRMMQESLYACEDELRQGYFTMAGGLRVGVCGRLNASGEGLSSMSGVGSACIRIPREARGCALPLVEGGRPGNLLLVSPPGMGKTTLIRDYARLISDAGWNVAIADERRELAACREGVPAFDVGMRTDVMDGCPKAAAVSLLVRACAPDLVVADEIGGPGDADALLDAMRCGTAVAATAHASGFGEAIQRFGALAGAFERMALLGPVPGRIERIWKREREGVSDGKGLAAVDDTDCLRRCGQGALGRKKAQDGDAGRTAGCASGAPAAHAQFAGAGGHIAAQERRPSFAGAGQPSLGGREP